MRKTENFLSFMGSFVLIASPVPNTPKRPLVIPCYHCQIAQFRIPVKNQVQNTSLLLTNDSKFILHQKLETLHYTHHSSEISNTFQYTPAALSSTSAAIHSNTFFTRIGEVWLANLDILSTSLLAMGASSLAITTSVDLRCEQLCFST